MKTPNKLVIEVKELVKSYPGVKAVDRVSFEIGKGEIFGMLGPNGAGKTTIIECVEGFRQPDQGAIRVLGLDPRKDGYRLRERIGIQFQSAALPDRIKVWEVLDLFASFYQKPGRWQPLLDILHLADKSEAYFSKLSGGQKQRVFIALALVNDPEIVFLDELTTGLDPQSRRAMWELVKDIREQGKTIFLTTHFMEEAERLCDRVAIIDHGKLVALDTPQNLINSLGDESRVTFSAASPVDHGVLNATPGVSRVEQIGERILVYGQKDGLISNLVKTLEINRIGFDNLHADQPTLEDVFLKLTGKEMRN